MYSIIKMEITLFLEIKNEFTEQLSDILTPFIWEGMNSIYKSAASDAMKSENEDKTLLIFQKYLQKVATWNQLQIDEETLRIKTASKTIDYLDDLVKAVIKSNITLLTYSNTETTTISQNFYDTLKTSSFIHLCYIECAKDAHNNPYLFYHDVSPMDLKRNQLVIHQNIEQSIHKAVKKMLPLKIILNEYLSSRLQITNPWKQKTYGEVELVDNSKISDRNSAHKIDQQNKPVTTNLNGKTILSNIDHLNKEPSLVSTNYLLKKVKSDNKKFSQTKKNLNKKLMNVMSDMNLRSINSLKNTKLNQSGSNILNIDNVSTNVNTEPLLSNTTMSDNLFQKKNYPEVETDIINPDAINLIEDYGKKRR